MTWSDRWEFRAWLGERHYAPASVDTYTRYVARCHELLAADRSLRSLRRAGPDEIRAFLAMLPATASSWNQARSALRLYYQFAGRGRSNPVDQVAAVPNPVRLPRPLDADGHLRFLEAARELGGAHELVGLLFATTGCRFSELQLARWNQFDLGATGALWRITGKGAGRRGPKPRQVPLHSAVAPVVRAWRAMSSSPEWVLSGGSRAGHQSVGGLRRTFREICDRAGLEGVVPHQLRHTVATRMLELRRDLREVQEFLGHASSSSTQVYTQVLPSRLRDAVEALPA